MSSKTEHLPSRDDAIGLVGGTGLSVALLALGGAMGATVVGVQVQSTGCAGQFLTGACTILPAVETWAGRLVGLAVLGFIAAFAAEYHAKEEDE